MKPLIKIPYKDFIQYAILAIKEDNPKIKPETIKFMKTHSYESDGECYEIPDYIELEIEL